MSGLCVVLLSYCTLERYTSGSARTPACGQIGMNQQQAQEHGRTKGAHAASQIRYLDMKANHAIVCSDLSQLLDLDCTNVLNVNWATLQDGKSKAANSQLPCDATPGMRGNLRRYKCPRDCAPSCQSYDSPAGTVRGKHPAPAQRRHAQLSVALANPSWRARFPVAQATNLEMKVLQNGINLVLLPPLQVRLKNKKGCAECACQHVQTKSLYQLQAAGGMNHLKHGFGLD
jgi:hypothetical protein